MNFRRFIEMLRGSGARWFGRRRATFSIPMESIRGQRHSWQAPVNDFESVEPEVMEPADDGILNNAIADYLAPSHRERDFIEFTRINERGKILQRSQNFERRNNAMEITTQESRVETKSGLIAKPEEVRCRCHRCGAYDLLFGVCCRCGKAYCGSCSVQMVTPQGVLTLCKGCHRREAFLYDSWAAVDARDGTLPRIPVAPARPFSTNAGIPSWKGR